MPVVTLVAVALMTGAEVRVDWVRTGPAADSCPPGERVEAALAARLRGPVPEGRVEALVRPDPKGWVAELLVSSSEGRRGRRILRASPDACAALATASAVAAALLFEAWALEDGARGGERSPAPGSPGGGAAGRVAPENGERGTSSAVGSSPAAEAGEGDGPGAPRDPPPAAPPRGAPPTNAPPEGAPRANAPSEGAPRANAPSEGAPPGGAPPGGAPPGGAPPEPPRAARLSVAAGVVGAAGTLPGAALGARIEARLRTGGSLVFGLALEALPERRTEAFGFSLVAARLSLGLRWAREGWGLGGDVGAHAGAYSAFVLADPGLEVVRPGAQPWLALSVLGRIERVLFGPLRAGVELGPVVSLLRRRFEIGGTDRAAHEEAPLALWGAISLGVAFDE